MAIFNSYVCLPEGKTMMFGDSRYGIDGDRGTMLKGCPEWESY